MPPPQNGTAFPMPRQYSDKYVLLSLDKFVAQHTTGKRVKVTSKPKVVSGGREERGELGG